MPARFFAGAGPIRLAINADTTNYNIFTQAGFPSLVSSVVLTIAAGVKVGHISTGSSWQAGSKIRIAYAGARIYGPGGDGGDGGAVNGAGIGTDPTAGANGSNALSLGWDVELDWGGTGEMFGGGGGGGGGGWSNNVAGLNTYTGAGGGGQAGGAGGNGLGGAPTDGANGTQTTAGDGGVHSGGTSADGGKGGSWGAAGKVGGATGLYAGKTGGAAGKAIDLNGHVVSWIGGTPGSTNLKGAVS